MWTNNKTGSYYCQHCSTCFLGMLQKRAFWRGVFFLGPSSAKL